MMIPISFSLRTKKGNIQDIASALQKFALDHEFADTMAEQVFVKFKNTLTQQLRDNRHTVGYKAGTYTDAHGYVSRVNEGYTPGAFLGTLRYTMVPTPDGVTMRIEMGGIDADRPGATGRFVKYSRLIDKAFGPYVRTITSNKAFFGARRGVGGQFTRLRPGLTFKMNQPIDSKVAWMDAISILNNGRKVMQEVTRELKAYFAIGRTGRPYYAARDPLGRFTKV